VGMVACKETRTSRHQEENAPATLGLQGVLE